MDNISGRTPGVKVTKRYFNIEKGFKKYPYPWGHFYIT